VSNLEASMRLHNKITGFEQVCRLNTGAGFLSNGNTHHDLGLVQTTDKSRLGRDGKPLPSSRLDGLRCEFYAARKAGFGTVAAQPAAEQPYLI
jgi:catechol-2,3-dioxygenase